MAVTPNGLFELIERGCDDSPDRLALTFGECSWTWSELRRRILCLAVALRAEGIGEGDRIAFLDTNHPACLEATFRRLASRPRPRRC